MAVTVDGEQVHRIRVHEEAESPRDFDVEEDVGGDDILYLQLPTHDLRGLREWIDEELEEVDAA